MGAAIGGISGAVWSVIQKNKKESVARQVAEISKAAAQTEAKPQPQSEARPASRVLPDQQVRQTNLDTHNPLGSLAQLGWA